MAWVERMPSGRYRGCYRDSASKKQYVTDQGKGYARKSDAKDAANEAEVRARREAARSQGTLSAKTKWGDWWDLIVEKRRRPDTATDQTERDIVRKYLRPKWAEVPLNKITYRAVQDWIDTDLKVRAGMSPGYVHRIYGVFALSINKAVSDEVLTASPCAKVKLPTVPKKAQPYTEASHVEAVRIKLHQVYNDMVNFEIETGLRPNELCGLHVDHIDDTGWINVEDVLVDRRKVIRHHPKNKNARRVPLTMKALEILERNLADRNLKRGCGLPHMDGKPCRSELVFRGPSGRPVTSNNFAGELRRAAKRAGVVNRSPYANRRAFATNAGHGGLDAFDLAAFMGHSDLKQTRDYVQQTEAARVRLQAALGQPPALTLVRGARGAAHGANPEKQATQTHANGDAANTG